MASLEGRRDTAAVQLRFEVAARLQEEIAATVWVVSPQQVTRADGGDADLQGWADRRLVRLQVRDGRLRSWEQESIPHVGSGFEGPPSWARFLSRNAVLAAALDQLPVS